MRMSHLRFRTVIEMNDSAYAEHVNAAIKGSRSVAGRGARNQIDAEAR